MKKITRLLLAVAAVAMVCTLASCWGGSGGGAEKTLKLVGSTSVGPVAEKLTEAYDLVDPHIKIEIEQVGSSAGIEATYNGSADIGMSSRDLSEDEIAKGLVGHEIAIDAMAVVLNPQNTVKSLTGAQIRDIFLGKIRNWSEVGGADAEIILVSREAGSGTRDAFESIMGVQFEKNGKKASALDPRALVAEGTGAIKSSVATKPRAIGYISLGYVDQSVKPCDIDGISATEENIRNRTYMLARPFLMVTSGEPGGDVADFIDWVRSDGQDVVKDSNYMTIE